MSTVDPVYDVDDQGILDPEEPVLAAVSVVRQERTVSLPSAESAVLAAALERPSQTASGNSNLLAGRDVNISFHPESTAEEPHARVKEPQGRGLLDPAALEKLELNYVAPPGLLGDEPESAIQILRDRRVLMITAEGPACGQFSAGVRLSYELRKRHPELVVREELIDAEFRLTARYLQLNRDPTALLVDLRDSDEINAVRRALVDFSRELEQHRSYLILIIPHHQASSLADQFPGRVHLLRKPSSVEVFARHLDQVDGRELVTAEAKADELERLWPPKVKELADAVSNGINRAVAPAQALRDALQGRTPDLRKAILEKQEKSEPEWLALLLAASVLEGAEPQHIVNAATEMLAYNKLARNDKAPPLLRLSPHSRLTRLDFASFEPETREFQPQGFGVQVLRHFWREHPDLRDLILRWIGELPRVFRDLSSEELEQIADRSAEIALEGGHRIALELAEQWARTTAGGDVEGSTAPHHPANRYRRSIAVRLLTTTAADMSLGPGTRQRLLNWSKGVDADLQLLTAEVCAGLGHSFPRIALTRLKHLASSGNGHVRRSVLTGMQQIAGELGVSRFLRYLSEWFDDATPARLQLLSEGVTAVLKGQTGDVEPDAAESFWQQALDRLPPKDLRPVVATWLRATATLPTEAWAAMVEPLVRATRSESIRIAQMQYASRMDRATHDLESVGDDPVADVRYLLWTRLDEVDPILRQE